MRSLAGGKMSAMSGLRVIMDDIAAHTADSSDEWINLGIGNPARIPAVTSFWHGRMTYAMDQAFEELSCSYGPSRGLPVLLDAISEYFGRRLQWTVEPDNVLVGPGSQMLCFIASTLYAGPSAGGDRKVVLPALPDYTGYESLTLHPHFVGVASDITCPSERRFAYQLDMNALANIPDAGVYLVSSPSNPTGRALTAAELARIVGLADERGAVTVIDNAYGEPFPGIGDTSTPPLWGEQVINCFSFSKAGLPGERIGFAIGPSDLITDMVAFLGNTTLHAPRLAQFAAADALSNGAALDSLVRETIQPFYAERRALFEKLLDEEMPSGIRWRTHIGSRGMFCWLWIDEPWFDDQTLYALMKQRHTFIVPGSYFFAGCTSPSFARHGQKCVRISLCPPPEALCQGAARLVDALRAMEETSGR